MILGIGCDIIETQRIRDVLKRQEERFLERILTPDELALASRYRDPSLFLAGRFAAKEALAKALGCGIGEEFSWHSVSILNDPAGKPYVKWLHGIQERLNISNTHLSIAHSETVAMAYVILEALPKYTSSCSRIGFHA